MSAQDKIGQLIGTNQQRDAVHIALHPITAKVLLHPGQRIGLDKEGRAIATVAAYVGVVDPFLWRDVQPGETFWLFLIPNTITTLRHHWVHPQFPEAPPTGFVPDPASVGYLTSLAGELDDGYDSDRNMSYADLLDVLDEAARTGGYCFGHDDSPQRMWTAQDKEDLWGHYERATGRPARPDRDANFRCAC